MTAPSRMTTPTEPIPPPHPSYVPAPTKRLRNGDVEMDAGKWLGLLQTAEFYTKGKRV
jgi:hypothetical protein